MEPATRRYFFLQSFRAGAVWVNGWIGYFANAVTVVAVVTGVALVLAARHRHSWTWQLLVILGILILVVALFEGCFREWKKVGNQKALAEAAVVTLREDVLDNLQLEGWQIPKDGFQMAFWPKLVNSSSVVIEMHLDKFVARLGESEVSRKDEPNSIHTIPSKDTRTIITDAFVSWYDPPIIGKTGTFEIVISFGPRTQNLPFQVEITGFISVADDGGHPRVDFRTVNRRASVLTP